MNYYRRFKMSFLNHRTKIIITLGVILLIVLSIYGMMSLESYYRNITLAQMPISILLVMVNALIFVYLYVIVLRNGFTTLDKKGVKAKEVNVRFTDVVGIDEAKDRKSTRLNSSHSAKSRMPSSA